MSVWNQILNGQINIFIHSETLFNFVTHPDRLHNMPNYDTDRAIYPLLHYLTGELCSSGSLSLKFLLKLNSLNQTKESKFVKQITVLIFLLRCGRNYKWKTTSYNFAVKNEKLYYQWR